MEVAEDDDGATTWSERPQRVAEDVRRVEVVWVNSSGEGSESSRHRRSTVNMAAPVDDSNAQVRGRIVQGLPPLEHLAERVLNDVVHRCRRPQHQERELTRRSEFAAEELIEVESTCGIVLCRRDDGNGVHTDTTRDAAQPLL